MGTVLTPATRIVKLSDDTCYIERTGGADLSLPPVIWCHGNGGSYLDLTGIIPNVFLNHVVQSGFKIFTNNIGGVSAMNNDDAMADIDDLYQLATGGSGQVFLVGHSMGGGSSTFWASQNIEKVKGVIGMAPFIRADWGYNGVDDRGEGTDPGPPFIDIPTLLDAAYEGGWEAVKTERDPYWPGSDQLQVILDNKDKFHHVIAVNDNLWYPNCQFRQFYILRSHCTLVSGSTHSVYNGPAYDDRFLTQQLNIWLGKQTYKPYKDLVLAEPNLVHYWICDETSGTTLKDSKGSNDLTLAGTYQLDSDVLVSGEYHGSFDTVHGTSGYAYNRSYTPVVTQPKFTYEMWFRTKTTGSNVYFLSENHTSNNDPLSGLTIKAGGTLQWFFRTAGTNFISITSTDSYNDSQVHHVVATGDGTTLSLYVDSELVGTSTYPAGSATFNALSLGALYRSSVGNYTDGVYGHVAMYNDALPEKTIIEHYKNGIGYFA